jgi:hypothetical protein
MADTAGNPSTILLKGTLRARYEEYTSAGTITPGHLIEDDNTGKVIVHGTDGGAGEKIFAIEDALQGKTVADNYASGDLVRVHHAQLGDIVNAVLKASQTVTNDLPMCSAGDGSVRKTTATSDIVLARCQTVLTASVSTTTRVRLRIL